jgi:hypothetical protein
VTRFEDTLRGRVDATYIPFQAKFSAKGSVLVSSAERDAIVDALARGRDLQSWLDNAGLWQPDDPEFLATSRNHRIALARLDGVALYDAKYVDHDEQGRPLDAGVSE